MNTIDFENIKWGSFTKQFQAYKSQHPKSRIKDLDAFAKMVIKNPNKYQPRTLKRARFYLNVIEKKGGKLSGGMMSVNDALKLAGEIAGGIGGYVLLDRLYKWAYHRFQNNEPVPVPIAELLHARHLELPEAEAEPAEATPLADVEMGRGFPKGIGKKGMLTGRVRKPAPLTQEQQIAEDQAELKYFLKKYREEGLSSKEIDDNMLELIDSKHPNFPRARELLEEVKRLIGLETTGGKLSISSVKGLLDNSYKKHPDNYLDFELDKELSGQEVQVYKKKGDKQAVVVHRGTATMSDWLTDLKYVLGYDVKKDKRFQRAEDIQRKAESKYGAENISTLGHSLGSKVASSVGQNSHEIINLNKAVSPLDALKKTSEKETNLRTQYDPVSFLLPFTKSKNIITIPSKTLNPLAEHKIDTLDRLETPDAEVGRGLHKKSIKELKKMVKALPLNRRIKLSKIKKSELVEHLSKQGGKIDEPTDLGSLYEYHLDNWYKKNGY